MQDAIIDLAVTEVQQRQLAFTRRVLDRLTIPSENGRPRIARIDEDESDHVIVYFPIEGRSYFFAVRVDRVPEPRIRGCSVEAGSEAYLVSYSTTHRLDDLLALTTLPPTEQWDMVDGIPSSGFHIKIPMPLADSPDDNVNRLLDMLEEDREGLKQLGRTAPTYIQLHWYGYTPALSLFKFKPSTLQRLADLNLGLDLDVNVSGA